MTVFSSAPVQAPLASRPTPPAQLVAPSIASLMPDCSMYERMEDWQVPEAIAGTEVWQRVSSIPKDMYVLCATETVLALLVVLRDSGRQFVIKTWPACRAAACQAQVMAELEAAECFAVHPLMPTVVAFSEGKCEGDQQVSFCSVMPYAGNSIRSLINNPDWFQSVTDNERLAFARLLVTQSLTVFKIMQQTGGGHLYRDVKPDNYCVGPTTGLIATIDYGLMVSADLSNFHPGETHGYFTPELVNPEGDFAAFCELESRMAATNNTTDTFLTSYAALEVAIGLTGLPWLLQDIDHDVSTPAGLHQLLCEHAEAASAGYAALINRVACPLARDFFRQTMCANPTQRLTPAEALHYPWLCESRAVVGETLAAASATYEQDSRFLVDLFSGLPGVILPQQQQQYGEAMVQRADAARQQSAGSLDVACSLAATDSLEHCNRSTTSTTSSSSCGSHDTESAAGDQLYTTPTASAGCKFSFLRQGTKLLKKMARFSGIDTAHKHSKQPAGSHKTTATAVVVTVDACLEETTTCAVAVPGFCGMRWFRKSQGVGSS